MSTESKRLRDRAAAELRNSRKAKNPDAKATEIKRADGYKQLAANEEWLAGEKTRSRPNPK